MSARPKKEEYIKVSDYVADFLYAQGVRHVFVVAGGMITYLLDSIHRHGRLDLVDTHHEQAAAFAADAMGRITGIPGVAMATSGPGATNLLTGIGSCYFDSSPAVFITGQVNRNEQKGRRSVRQLGFQETDIVSMAESITKAAWRVSSPGEVPDLLAKAFSVAASGRPGPVLVDIPMDVQRESVEFGSPGPVQPPADNAWELRAADELLDALSAAQRPLILAGGGIRSARAVDLFRTFAELAGVPVVNSLMAVDVLPYGNPLRAGMIGTYGNRWANLAVGLSDFLLVLGSRLDVRQTGSDTMAFKGNRIIYHVDIDASEINNRVKGCEAIVTHLHPFLAVAIETLDTHTLPDWRDWLVELAELRRQHPDTVEARGTSGINPNEFMHQLSAASQPAAAFVVDVGQNQMWAAQSLELQQNQRFLASGGMGAMGFALPAGVGATYACSEQPVVVISGDGGLQLNIQELQTIASSALPVKMIVLNNKCYGMVRQFQQSYFEARYTSTYWGYTAPDFAQVAQAYGIPAFTIWEGSEVKEAMSKLWHNPRQPVLMQVMLDPLLNVYPKIAFGRPITEMEPSARPVDI